MIGHRRTHFFQQLRCNRASARVVITYLNISFTVSYFNLCFMMCRPTYSGPPLIFFCLKSSQYVDIQYFLINKTYFETCLLDTFVYIGIMHSIPILILVRDFETKSKVI